MYTEFWIVCCCGTSLNWNPPTPSFEVQSMLKTGWSFWSNSSGNTNSVDKKRWGWFGLSKQSNSRGRRLFFLQIWPLWRHHHHHHHHHLILDGQVFLWSTSYIGRTKYERWGNKRSWPWFTDSICRGLPENSDKWSALVRARRRRTNKQTALTQKWPNLGVISGPEFCQMVWAGRGKKA